MTAEPATGALDPAEVAVITPVLNEAARLPALLEHLAAYGFGQVVVADGGSCDGSARIAGAQPGVTLVRAPRGRAVQQRAGAAAARGARVLLFLHADTRLPPDAVQHMSEALAGGAAGGCFRLRFDRRHPLLALYGWASRWDSYWTSFGDQALFARRDAYDAVGGVPDLPFLEDVAFRRALRRRGQFVKCRARVVTSARRFEAEGFLRRQLKNGAILVLHALGVSAARLARWYR